jgi:hypothetical protein
LIYDRLYLVVFIIKLGIKNYMMKKGIEFKNNKRSIFVKRINDIYDKTLGHYFTLTNTEAKRM